MKIISLITNDSKCGANFVHYTLARKHTKWSIISLRKSKEGFYDEDISSLNLTRLSMLNIRKVIKKLKVMFGSADVIIGDGVFSYLYLHIIKKTCPKLKVYALVHNDYTQNNRTNWGFVPDFIFTFIYDIILSKHDVITTSRSAYEAISQRCNSVDFIDNGVDKPISRSGFSSSDTEVNYWFIGRFVKVKQLDLLVLAFKRLPKNCVLNLVGDGPLKSKILSLCIESGINFKDWGYSDKPFENVSKGDVFVLPSLLEGRSIALMEAILCGCSCVVSNIPSNNEFVPYGAIPFDVNSDKDLTDKLLMLSSMSEIERFSMIDYSKASKCLSTDNMLEKYLRIFNETK
nr:glycosyltransferase family 4 protein [uncultured Vibrio sp.]